MERQAEQIEAVAKTRGDEVVKITEDVDVSGAVSPFDRADLGQPPACRGVFDEGMPSACYPGTYYNDTKVSDGPYKIGHDNGVPFAGVYNSPAECANVQPLSTMDDAALPAVSFVAPNLCDDMHGIAASSPYAKVYADCVTGPTGSAAWSSLAARGDDWLAARVPEWTAAGADVLITFDGGSGYASVSGSTGGGGQVYAVLLGPGVTLGADSAPMNVYSVLAAVEDPYGLPLLGNVATATPIPVG